MKAKFFALVALVLGLASCQNDPEGLNVSMGGEILTTVNVGIPESETRAGGVNSAQGAITNIDLENTDYTLRYIFQVFDENGTASKDKQVKFSDDTDVAFEVRLVPERKYTFVVWADIVEDSKADDTQPFNNADYHYNTANFPVVAINENTWVAMDETRDAFTGKTTETSFTSASDITVTLTRPFAKLRVVTTDMAALGQFNIVPDNAVVTYKTDMRTSFNAFEGTAAGASLSNKTHTYEIASYGETGNERTIFADYFFADNDVVKFEMRVNEDGGRKIAERFFNTDINVKRNYLTTLKGAILTDGGDVNVELKPGLGGNENPNIDYTVITSGSQIQDAINNGGSYMLGSNIYVASTRASLFAATRTATTTNICLNGYAITFADNATITVPAGKTLIITDEPKEDGTKGAIVVGNNAGFVNEGTITLEGGNIDDDTIENKAGATVKITDGSISEEVIKDGSVGTVANYAEALVKALTEGTETGTYTLPADVTLANDNSDSKIGYVLPADVTLILDLNGHTIKTTSNEITSSIGAFVDVRGTLTVKNGTITTEHLGADYGNDKGAEIFYVCNGGTINVENATLENLGGTKMAYCIDVVNATTVTVNVDKSTLKSTYIPFRVFNNGNGMNNVTIKNTRIEGVNRAFWVHIYSNADNNGKGVKSATLNLDIYGNGNTFVASNPNRIIEFGFTDEINFNAEGEQIVYNASRLKSIANYVNSGYSFNGKSVKLVADIDLGSAEWTPIGNNSNKFNGTFDGQNHKISNLVVTGHNSYVGLFGFTTNGEIKNLVVENAKVSGRLGVGVVAGSPYTSKFTNITVQGHVEVNGMAYVGGVGGRNAYANWTDVTVDVDSSSYVNANSVEDGTAYRTYVGGIVGFNGEGGHSFKNITSNINVVGSTTDVGGLFGIAHYSNKFENCSCSGNVEVTGAESAEGAQEIGGIAGVWHNQDGTEVHFDNCKFTGTLKANIEGVEFCYGGLIGKPYGNGSGKLYIDGMNVIADGVAMNAEGEYLISKAAGLTWFSDQLNNKKNTFAGKTIKVVNDIDMAGVTYYGGSVASYPSYCFKGTFDGGEKVISNLTITVENDTHGAAALIPTLAGDGTTIKNVTLKNVNISSSHYAAGIWGYTTSENCWINVTNCHVEGGAITGNIYNGDNADKVGGIGGIFYTGTVSNCSVKGVTISGYRDTAGIVGWAANANATIKNNVVENVTINVNNATNYKKYTKRAEYDVNSFVGEGVGTAKIEDNTGEATINWGSIAE